MKQGIKNPLFFSSYERGFACFFEREKRGCNFKKPWCFKIPAKN